MAGHPGMAAGFAARQCRLSSLPTAPAPSVRRRATSNGAIPVVRLTANLRARSRLRPPPEGRRSLACRAEKTPQFSKIDVESSTGLGDTSQEPFGPCVRLTGRLVSAPALLTTWLTRYRLHICAPPHCRQSFLWASLSSKSPPSRAVCRTWGLTW